jgi:hypothetical protein
LALLVAFPEEIVPAKHTLHRNEIVSTDSLGEDVHLFERLAFMARRDGR